MTSAGNLGNDYNRSIVEEGAAILHRVLAEHVEDVLKSEYGGEWWQKGVIENLHDADTLPKEGDCSNLKLGDMLVLIQKQTKLFPFMYDSQDERWAVFGSLRLCTFYLEGNARGISDRDTERHLDTMVRFCRPFNQQEAQKIDEIYCGKRFGTDAPPSENPASGPVIHGTVGHCLQVLLEVLSPIVSQELERERREGGSELACGAMDKKLDLLACLRVIHTRNSRFRSYKLLTKESTKLLFEVQAIRNRHAHSTVAGMSQRDAERDLDTLYRFCLPFDKAKAEEIDEEYRALRNGILKNEVTPSSGNAGVSIDLSDVVALVEDRLKAFKTEILDGMTKVLAEALGRHPGTMESQAEPVSGSEVPEPVIGSVAVPPCAGGELPFKSEEAVEEAPAEEAPVEGAEEVAEDEAGVEEPEEAHIEQEIEIFEEDGMRGILSLGTAAPWGECITEDTEVDVLRPMSLNSLVVVPPNVTLTIRISDTLTFVNEASIVVNGTLNIEGSSNAGIISDESHTCMNERGGAIFGTKSSNIHVSNCLFQGFEANFGGAVDSAGNLSIDCCEFRGCTAYYGGAVNCSHELNLEESTFQNCNAAFGGAVNFFLGRIDSCKFEGCEADEYGNAIYAAAANSFIIHCEFSGYPSERNAIYCAEDAEIYSCSYSSKGEPSNLTGNLALHLAKIMKEFQEANEPTTSNADVLAGGTLSSDTCWEVSTERTLRSDIIIPKGVSLVLKVSSRLVLESGSRFTVHGSLTIEGENGAEFVQSSGQGNAIFVGEDGSLSVSGCKFVGFVGYFGGAINSSGKLKLDRCSFEDCTANCAGGAVFSKSADMSGCTFAGCTAGKSGNAVYSEGDVSLLDCTFRGYEGQEDAVSVWGDMSATGCEFQTDKLT